MKLSAAFLGLFLFLDRADKMNLVVGQRSKNSFYKEKQSEQQIERPNTAPKWRLVFNPCGASCGGSYQRSKAVCMQGDFLRVDDSECPGDQRPTETTQPCGQQPCFATRWLPFNYSECSATCGPAFVYQVVKCYIGGKDDSGKDSFVEVAERMCSSKVRPPLTAINCTVVACTTLAVAKVNQVDTAGGTPRNNGADVCALQAATLVVSTASALALLRIYLFDT